MTPWPSTRRSRTDAIVQMTRSADGQHVPAPSPGPSLSAYAAGLPEVSRLIRQRIESGPGGTGASCPVPANSATGSGDTEAGATADILPAVAVAASVPVAAVTITWADGTVTAVHPPEAPARPVNATPAHWPRGLPGSPWLLGRQGTVRPSRNVAWYRSIDRFTAVMKVCCRLASPGNCDCWLAVWLPVLVGFSVFECVVWRQLNVCVFAPFWHARDTAGMTLARMGLL